MCDCIDCVAASTHIEGGTKKNKIQERINCRKLRPPAEIRPRKTNRNGCENMSSDKSQELAANVPTETETSTVWIAATELCANGWNFHFGANTVSVSLHYANACRSSRRRRSKQRRLFDWFARGKIIKVDILRATRQPNGSSGVKKLLVFVQRIFARISQKKQCKCIIGGGQKKARVANFLK